MKSEPINSMGANDVLHIDLLAIGETIPNLDGFTSPDELEAIRAECKAIAANFVVLGSYAEAKANAMRCRLKGNIPLALKFERACDVVLNQLPKSFRW